VSRCTRKSQSICGLDISCSQIYSECFDEAAGTVSMNLEATIAMGIRKNERFKRCCMCKHKGCRHAKISKDWGSGWTVITENVVLVARVWWRFILIVPSVSRGEGTSLR
jgi:hypothetical protein